MIQKIIGKVISGKKLGRTIGFPTANVEISPLYSPFSKGGMGGLFPGTYKVNIVFKEQILHGVGAYLENSNVFEVHIFDFSLEIYDETLEIILLEKIRENKKFNSLDELKSQIAKDIEYAKNKKSIVLTFGTFDVFHEGHKDFLLQAKAYSDYLITIIATDKNVFKIKGFKTKFSQEERKNEVENSNISDEVLVGSEDNPMIWLDKYKPDFICLGYDQTGFASKLDEYISKNGLKTQIIRLESYKPEIYKSSILKKNLT